VTPSQTPALRAVGSLQAGQLAGITVIDDEMSLQAVLRRGDWLTINA